jgi:hypothetical protein
MELRRGGVMGELVAAFVIDARGHVEPPSISFVKRGPDPLFRKAVCDFLVQARFVPLQRDGEPRRALVIMPFGFWIGREGASPPISEMAQYRRLMRETPPQQLFAELERQPHC